MQGCCRVVVAQWSECQQLRSETLGSVPSSCHQLIKHASSVSVLEIEQWLNTDLIQTAKWLKSMLMSSRPTKLSLEASTHSPTILYEQSPRRWMSPVGEFCNIPRIYARRPAVLECSYRLPSEIKLLRRLSYAVSCYRNSTTPLFCPHWITVM